MNEFKYRPDIDGLRSIAVLLVLLYHAGFGFKGGYIGVDVFFVISGFLITGIILKGREKKQFSLKNFWVRRIKRIIPAGTAVAAVTLIAGYFLLLPEDYRELGKSTIAQQLMLSNVYFMRNTGYFDGPADLMPLLHTWSLSVEEQFYLFYPFLMVLLTKFSRRVCLIVLSLLALVSLAMSQHWTINNTNFAFYMLPSRAWELILGGLIWFIPYPTKVHARLLDGLSIVALLALITAGWFYSIQTPFPGVNALLPCVASALLIYTGGSKLTLAGRLLATKPMVFIGLISYSLYLWHWPILAYMRYWLGEDFSLQHGALALALSFILAALSWKFIETPFRKGWPEARAFKVVGAGVVSTVVMLGLAFLVYHKDGMQHRIPERARAVAVPIERAPFQQLTPEQIRAGDVPRLGVRDAENNAIDFVLWGDSHAIAIQAIVDEAANESGLRGVSVVDRGAVPLIGVDRPDNQRLRGKVEPYNQSVLEYIKNNNVRNVIMASRWAVYTEGNAEGSVDPLPGPLLAVSGSEARDPDSARQALDTGFENTLNALRQSGVRVWVLKQVPLQSGHPPKTLFISLFIGSSLPSGTSLEEHLQRQQHVNRIIDKHVQSNDFVESVDLSLPFFDPRGYSMLGTEAGSYYRDDDHVSPFGSRELVKPLISEMMQRMSEQKASEVIR